MRIRVTSLTGGFIYVGQAAQAMKDLYSHLDRNTLLLEDLEEKETKTKS